MSTPHVRTLRDFHAENHVRRPDAVSPVAAAGINFIGGGVGQGKTLLGLEIAMTKASGYSRAGFTAEPGRVLFVAADMGKEDYDEYATLLEHPGRELAQDNLFITNPRGLYLDDPQCAADLRSMVKDYKADMVVLDYFSNFCAGDDFTNKGLRPVLDTLALIRDVDHASVVMLDQTRKAGNNAKPSGVPAADELYGGRAKSALADRILMIRRDPASGIFTITPVKERGASFAPINMTFDSEGGWQRDASQIHLTPGDAKVLAFIAAAPPGLPRTCKEIEQETRLSERAVRGAIARLVMFGQITEGVRRGREKTYRVSANSAQQQSAEFAEGGPQEETFDEFSNNGNVQSSREKAWAI